VLQLTNSEDCGILLVQSKRRDTMTGHKKVNRPGLATVYTAFGQLEAQVIKTKLESAGIPALLDYESLGVVLGLTVDGLGEVRVMVPEALAQEAEELLSQPPDWPPDQEPD
jgi:hypothetical protein